MMDTCFNCGSELTDVSKPGTRYVECVGNGARLRLNSEPEGVSQDQGGESIGYFPVGNKCGGALKRQGVYVGHLNENGEIQ